MKTFDELILALNKADIPQNELRWMEDIPTEIWNDMVDRMTLASAELYVDKHRWHETSITVVKIDDRFMGVEHVSDVFSEQMGVSDIYHTLKFFEMIEVNQPTYIRKI